jgi:hypothetical protein
MKKIALIFILIFSITSCISTKSTIQNINNDAIRPQIKGKQFVFTEYAKDSNYGIDSDYPINIGIISIHSEESFVSYFFNGIEGKNGEKIEYKKIDTCCPFPTKHSNMGAGLLTMYEANLEGSTKKQTFYFNIYEKGNIVCPKGFSIKKIEEMPE